MVLEHPPEPETLRPPRSRESGAPIGKVLIGAVGLAAVGAVVVWFVGQPEPRVVTEADVPLVTANPNPAKRQPEEPGGVEIRNLDMLVYGMIDPAENGQVVERLLPPPEEPVAVEALPPPPEPAPERIAAATVLETLAEIAPAAGTASVEPDQSGAAVAPLPSRPPEPVATDAAEPQAQSGMDFAAAEAAVAALAEPPKAKGAWRIQVGAFKAREQAEQEWRRVIAKAADLLAGMAPKIESVDLGADQGIFHRLQVVAFADRAGAEAMCAKLGALGVDCLVVKP